MLKETVWSLSNLFKIFLRPTGLFRIQTFESGQNVQSKETESTPKNAPLVTDRTFHSGGAAFGRKPPGPDALATPWLHDRDAASHQPRRRFHNPQRAGGSTPES